ncbi:MAG: hypothetical protein OPY06_03390 [Nitrosopumilus sp.]|nr:hypothetical protein [Nitrosopumilus sp.]MDF2423046.1 hypothetical protein [Nitrosopumilus sp.]MDF2424324.1 hypothetical protein [Nitrosopumilus sp.]MDF2425320.1 hypothetical protein [Nitrosopumilus sp.]MDF2427136.1 hypothetical protein [Nitrosopumilus sp.]
MLLSIKLSLKMCSFGVLKSEPTGPIPPTMGKSCNTLHRLDVAYRCNEWTLMSASLAVFAISL